MLFDSVESFPCPVEGCTRIFKSRHTCTAHVRRQHPDFALTDPQAPQPPSDNPERLSFTNVRRLSLTDLDTPPPADPETALNDPEMPPLAELSDSEASNDEDDEDEDDEDDEDDDDDDDDRFGYTFDLAFQDMVARFVQRFVVAACADITTIIIGPKTLLLRLEGGPLV